MVYFISGHRDITQEEFDELYAKKISDVLEKDSDPKFVVGDYEGVDIMAQDFLCSRDMEDRVTIYHMGYCPRFYNPDILMHIGGFVTDESRDLAMTMDSDFDIAFVRKGKEKKSGTAINIRRRVLFGKKINFFKKCLIKLLYRLTQ